MDETKKMNLFENTDENEVWGLNDPHLKSYPKQGIGKRAMACHRYDYCLHKAAVKDWETFNCEGCCYEKSGRVDFIPFEFAPFEDDFDTMNTDESELSNLEMDCYKGLLAFFEEDTSNHVNPA